MKYRYYVHNTESNTGVTEFNSDIPEIFFECLADCVEWLMYESLCTLFYEITLFIENQETKITFSCQEADDGIEDWFAVFTTGNTTKSVLRDNVRDYIKSNF